jgi:hypothetical protein
MSLGTGRSSPAAACLFLLCARSALAASPAPAQSAPAVNYREPERSFQTVQPGQWTVLIEEQLPANEPHLAKRALARLENKLGATLMALPDSAHALFRKLPIFLMYGSKAEGGGRDSGAEYFQRNAPAYHKELDPRWKSCVVIYSARNYVQLSEFWSVKVLVHELAHAFQLERWPEKQPDIYQAWQNAVKRGLYRKVKDDKGAILETAYAAKNQLEYFAELSCMYFVGCNYQPFNREELKSYDPVGYEMIEKMWDIKK